MNDVLVVKMMALNYSTRFRIYGYSYYLNVKPHNASEAI